MVRRILYNDGDTMPAVTDYDLIIVDEAHRGYILDKDMTESEVLYTDQKDYQSKYRAVIDYFDAIKIGLTATPALQTTQIFGEPVYQYTYRQAVIDGYLVDHDAPHELKTKLSTEGIHYKKGDTVTVYDPVTNEITDGALLDDEVLDFDLLAAEFAKVKRKNLMIKDLNDLVQERLSKMMAVNPTRVDYYVRYMGIIETYNAEQDRTTIEKTFMELMDLAKSMSEEEQRYAREGFSSDEELSIYDLLFSENLSKSDIDKIKKMSKDLLQKIKERIAGMDHWTDKQETRAAVDVLIRNVLYEEIPDSMFDRLEAYRKAIYEHIYTHYKQAA